MSGEFDGDEMQCSYCGKWIYADSPRCSKCGNYTDGLGSFSTPMKDGRRLPKIYVIVGWLVLICFVGPLLVQFYLWLSR